MSDNFNNTDFELEEESGINRPYESRNKKPVLLLSIIGLLVVVIIVISYFAFLYQSDYEVGIQYLGQRQYKEALYKFQEIPPTSKDFNNAQSKINYINGLFHYEEKKYAEAKEYLEKVSLTDEYFNETRLMLNQIEEILQAEELARQLDQNDEGALEDAEKELEQKIRDQDAARVYARSLVRLQDKFAAEFKLAELEDATGMRKNLRNLNDIRQEMLDQTYTSTTPEQQLIEFKEILNAWMNNRINVIQTAIREGAPSIQESSLQVKNLISDGDKIEEEIITEIPKLKSSYSF